MDTQKLYYEDSMMQTFTATVLECIPEKDRWAVVLDRTAFYPEGGGQPCDLGILGQVRVLEVREENGRVIHLCSGPIAPGLQISGSIDWDRRFDLMQQHTGEHIVSGIIHALYGYHNVGFHMGSDVITIDFDGLISTDALAQIEARANEAVWQDLPVTCGYPSPEQLPQIPYRTKKQLPWPVRIVEIPQTDLCACCGVHVPTTGRIGLIKLLSCTKFHQGVRIEMVCGQRALRLLSQIYEQNRLVSQAFSVKLLETGGAAKKMNETLAAEKFRSTGLEKRLFAGIAAGYRDAGNVVHFEDGLSGTGLRELADAIADSCGGTAAVLCGSDASGYNICVASRHNDLRELTKEINQVLHGRGGGKPGFFQGRLNAPHSVIEEFFRQFFCQPSPQA